MNKTESYTPSHRIDYEGAKMGMWIFLFTEVLFFGGLFLLYSAFRNKYRTDFHATAAELNVYFGTANTVILLTSSLAMALSITLLRKGNKKASIAAQGVTVALGLVFMLNKYIEWGGHISEGIYPNSPLLIEMSRGKIIFYSLYYVMTGLHGLHVLIGVAAIAGTMIFTHRELITRTDYVKLENTGLYWHFVDVVWIYLFPLFYLIT